MTSVGDPGAYNLIAEINQNNTTKQISKLVSATGSDVALDWKATALNAIQAEGKAGRGVAPTVGSRLLAITSLSVYDAVNAFSRRDTFRPYGQLNQIAEEVSLREKNTIPENARLFAELNVALADAGIVAWDAKYNGPVIQPRRDDLITGGFGEKHGISGTVTDPEWEPLLNPTPPFPDYISGHSSFGGAFAGVMTNFVG
ncbi:vanadium-dependent haloperoxidase [Microcoleus sp. herbarium2]|uniref:vanadium-dependent haloperoxidase n=1 Tax=Microcoleus sp. herbarium2 TaxID=3055433 RepID=UPI002FD410A5